MLTVHYYMPPIALCTLTTDNHTIHFTNKLECAYKIYKHAPPTLYLSFKHAAYNRINGMKQYNPPSYSHSEHEFFL